MTTIVWTCQVCGKPVADGAGYLELPLEEIRRLRREEDDLDRRYPRVNERGEPCIRAIPVTELPHSAQWHALHAVCDPKPDGDSWYWFDVHRIRTLAQLCAWTIHLSEKGWYGETDWTTVAHRKLCELGSPAYSVMAWSA